jgi:hypothetical protein
MDVRKAARDLTLVTAMNRARQRRWRRSNALTRAAVNSGMLTKQEASILRRSALTINAADRFGRVRASLLDRAQLWSDEAAAEDLNEGTCVYSLRQPTTSTTSRTTYLNDGGAFRNCCRCYCNCCSIHRLYRLLRVYPIWPPLRTRFSD